MPIQRKPVASARRFAVAFALAYLTLAPMAATAAASPQSDRESRVRAAVRKLEAGDSLSALLEIEAVLARHDEYWQAHFWKARIQASMGDDLGARQSLQRATELDPGNAELHFLSASIAWQLADFDAAWWQLGAAAQAGWSDRQVQELRKNLRRYSDEPEDMQQRLSAPGLLLDVGANVDAYRERSLRERLVFSAQVAVVREISLARYRLSVGAGEGEEMLVSLGPVADAGEVLFERTLATPTETALEELVEALEAELQR